MPAALRLPGWPPLPGTGPAPTAQALQTFPVPAVAAAEDRGRRHWVAWLAGWWLAQWAWWAQHPAPWSPGTVAAWDHRLATATGGPLAAAWRHALQQAWAAGHAVSGGAAPPDAATQASWRAAWRRWWDGVRDTLWAMGLADAAAGRPPPQAGPDWEHAWHTAGVAADRLWAAGLSAAYHGALFAGLAAPAWGYVAPIGDAKVCRVCAQLLEGRWFRLLPTPPREPPAADWRDALWPGKPPRRPDGETVAAVPEHPHCRHLITRIVHRPPAPRR